MEEIEGNKMKNKRLEGRDREKEGANPSELRKRDPTTTFSSEFYSTNII
jgi:hypothetical protein